MIAMYRRTFIIKVLFFIFIPPFFLKIGGRHPHQMFLLKLYNKWIHKTIKQEMFLIINIENVYYNLNSDCFLY